MSKASILIFWILIIIVRTCFYVFNFNLETEKYFFRFVDVKFSQFSLHQTKNSKFDFPLCCSRFLIQMHFTDKRYQAGPPPLPLLYRKNYKFSLVWHWSELYAHNCAISDTVFSTGIPRLPNHGNIELREELGTENPKYGKTEKWEVLGMEKPRYVKTQGTGRQRYMKTLVRADQGTSGP